MSDYLDEKGMSQAMPLVFRTALSEGVRAGLAEISLPAQALERALAHVSAPAPGAGGVRGSLDAMRGKIMDAALTVFARDGYHRATMDAVATLAGVGKGSVYRYFKGKEDLLHTLIIERCQSILAGINQVLSEGDDLIEQVLEAVRLWMEFIAGHQEL